MQGLTKRQEKVLDYITDSINLRGYPPTLREIGTHMGISSTNGVNDHLRALERKGYLKREDMKSRALKPVNMNPEKSNETVKVPVVERITSGEPILLEQNISETIIVDRFLVGTAREIFAFRVNGNAMKEAGIESGDFVFVKKQMFAEKGDIVLAMLGDNAAVRYYQPEKDQIKFVPANNTSSTVIINRQDFLPLQLLGVVTGIYRRIE
ncbi:MAG: repressor LexA [Deltaproteobacteria bacterium]|nr:repressor LexA [Deltaproteobacteria bacterium]